MLSGALAVLDVLMTSTLAPPAVSSIVTALGITSSVISFVLTTILSRPAMVRWRRWAWYTLTALWGSVMVCLVDFVYQASIAGVNNPGVKLGILIWVLSVGSLLWLVRSIFFTSFTRRRPASLLLGLFGQRPVTPFDSVRIPVFGVPFIDRAVTPQLGPDQRIEFPILLISDRGAHGLGVAQRFAARGIAKHGVVWLAFTRPSGIVYGQIKDAVARHEPGVLKGEPGWARRLAIIDCYSSLYLEGADRALDAARVPRGTLVTHCNPMDPLSVKQALQEALRQLQKQGHTEVRVVYDSLSDFVSVADRELVLPYLRWSIVWDEYYCVQSVYLVWPDVLEKPVTAEYLAWFGNAVLRLRGASGRYTATLEGVGSAPITVDYDDQLKPLPTTDPAAADTPAARIARLVAIVRTLFR